jgi:hypothetical protein
MTTTTLLVIEVLPEAIPGWCVGKRKNLQNAVRSPTTHFAAGLESSCVMTMFAVSTSHETTADSGRGSCDQEVNQGHSGAAIGSWKSTTAILAPHYRTFHTVCWLVQ